VITKFKTLAALIIVLASVTLAENVFAAEKLTIVENAEVCMVTDMYFAKKQIPVSHNGKTYYGCCENCKETLAKDSRARSAIDPISGKSVDKANAVIAIKADNSVIYFENKKTFDKFAAKTQ
jgi:YHS domain-containing protein